MATTGNLEMFRGDQESFRFVLRKDGAVFDITGASIEFRVKDEYGDADPGIFSKSVGSGVTIVDGPNGVVDVVVVQADTIPGVGNDGVDALYDLVISEVSGNVSIAAAGKFTIKPTTRDGTI